MTLLPLLFLAALLVSFANGANDNFKGVATLHGSGRLSYRKSVALATVTTLAGSLAAIGLAGELAQRFSGKGLVADAVGGSSLFLGAVAISAGATVLLATRLGFPVSTTHALTGGLLGAGLVLAGPAQVSWAALGSSFVLPLLLSPLLALLLAAAVYPGLGWTSRRVDLQRDLCLCVEAVAQLAASGPLGAGGARLGSGLRLSTGHVETCAAVGARTVLGLDARTVRNSVHVLTAGAVGFARGLNDTPKIAGLLVGTAAVGISAGMAVVAVAMAAGGLLAARRVARTLSFRITALDDEQGVSANVVTAALVILASPLGLPVSTTHVSGGALFGVGAASGRARWPTIFQIVAAWFTTLPLAAALAAATALVLRALP